MDNYLHSLNRNIINGPAKALLFVPLPGIYFHPTLSFYSESYNLTIKYNVYTL